MKKTLLILLITAAISACGDGGGSDTTNAPTDSGGSVQGDSGDRQPPAFQPSPAGNADTPQPTTSTPTPTPKPPARINHPPSVSAGADRSVLSGKTITLTPSFSDPDGDALRILWEELGGTRHAQSLSVDKRGTASFYIAPRFGQPLQLTFRVTVTDPSGASASDQITLTVKPVKPVSGAIWQDTTWGPEDGPVEVIGTLSVRAGVTLTIKPGTKVEVSHDDVDFLIEGKLVAVGSVDKPIIFTRSTRGNPVGFGWTGLEFLEGSEGTITAAIIEHATTAIQLNQGANFSMGGVLFQHNLYGIDGGISRRRVTLSSNSFYDNTVAIALFVTGDSRIYDNRFVENKYVFAGYVGAGNGTLVISHNNFIGNDNVITAQRRDDPTEPGVVTLPNNWWGTTSTAAIDRMIKDSKDDPRLKFLDYSPIERAEIKNIGAPYPEGAGGITHLGLGG